MSTKEERERDARKGIDKLVKAEFYGEFACTCPWLEDTGQCLATKDACEIVNCAPWHFRR